MTFLRGQDPTRIEYLLHYLMQQTRFPPGALGLSAISAIDHCLWDISAKALGVPMMLANVSQQFYQMARTAGYGKEDGSSVVKVIEGLAGVRLGAKKA
jgi:3-hydroxyisobutyrate dehydrogenase-like beta-hydroxyacid dehydrogenase